jgi:hypothetical protein
MRRITAVRITVSKSDGTLQHVERGCSRGLPEHGLQCSAKEWHRLESTAARLGALASGAGAYIMLEIDREELP